MRRRPVGRDLVAQRGDLGLEFGDPRLHARRILGLGALQAVDRGAQAVDLALVVAHPTL